MCYEVIDVLNEFYKNNNIDPNCYTKNYNEVYEYKKIFDEQIVFDEMKNRIQNWILRFDDDKEYFYELLKYYKYIPQEMFEIYIKEISNIIFDDINQNREILFITVPSENGTSSGGDDIRAALLKMNMGWGISKQQIICDITKIDKEELTNKRAIIFVDDILGTGFSLKRLINEFLELYRNNLSKDCLFGISAVFATKNAIKFIKKNIKKKFNIDVKEYIKEENYLRSCMKGDYIFPAQDVKKIEECIYKYEEEIGIEEEKNFVMGFRECKLLISFFYNTPNNTLCSFWKYVKNKNLPIFPRDEYRRPTIQNLEKSKQHSKENAYRKGCVDEYEDV